MTRRTSPWPAGTPSWADLSVPDLDVAKAFYADVLGWTYQETGEEYGGYVMAQMDGAAAAGIAPGREGATPGWTLYIASDDVDVTTAAVTAHGGTIYLPPTDIGPWGRMLIAADPNGAAFGVWQAGDHIGCGIVNEPGGLTWEDLRSTDPDAAKAFYTAVFDYSTEPVEMAGPDYVTFSPAAGEPPFGGMGGMMGADGQPAHWLLYFGVADADASVAAAEGGGGSVQSAVFQTPFGRMAGLADPAGATFWVVETAGNPEPDRSG